jgi:hypothetical protein
MDEFLFILGIPFERSVPSPPFWASIFTLIYPPIIKRGNEKFPADFLMKASA